MPRIAGVDIPREKRVEIELTYIYGIGRTRSENILAATRVDPDTRVRDLTDGEISDIRSVSDRHFKVEGELRRQVNQNIEPLRQIGSYRGLRHRRNLPVRGQHTRTNARTKRGQRRTVAGRRRTRSKK